MDTNELPFPVTADLVRMDRIRSETSNGFSLNFVVNRNHDKNTVCMPRQYLQIGNE